MPASALDAETLAALRDGFGGDVLADGDDGYEDARTIFNAMITRRPAAIAQCTSEDDVKAALAFAADNDLEVSVRSGGHAVAGASLTDGGLKIDMRRMNSASVDPEARTITVGGGAAWKDFDAATQPHGLAATGGRVSTTGVAGLSLGGGSGWLERKFGLACDNLLSATLVTADGRTVRRLRGREPRSVLGASRRRRQLRHRHRADLPPARDAGLHRGADDLAAGGRRRGDPRLPLLHRVGARRGRRRRCST